MMTGNQNYCWPRSGFFRRTNPGEFKLWRIDALAGREFDVRAMYPFQRLVHTQGVKVEAFQIEKRIMNWGFGRAPVNTSAFFN